MLLIKLLRRSSLEGVGMAGAISPACQLQTLGYPAIHRCGAQHAAGRTVAASGRDEATANELGFSGESWGKPVGCRVNDATARAGSQAETVSGTVNFDQDGASHTTR